MTEPEQEQPQAEQPAAEAVAQEEALQAEPAAEEPAGPEVDDATLKERLQALLKVADLQTTTGTWGFLLQAGATTSDRLEPGS